MKHLSAVLMVVLAVVATACAKTPDLAEVGTEVPADTATVAATTDTTTAPVTQTTVDAEASASTTSAIATTSVLADGSSTSTSTEAGTTTTVDADAPTPPSDVTCTATSTTSVSVSWAAPVAEEDVVRYKLYVDAGDGPFVQRGTVEVDEAAGASADPERHAATVAQVPVATPVDIAVTAFDASGNESGWNPVGIWYLGNGGSCNAGAPSEVSSATISRGAGSSEVNMTFLATAEDIESYDVAVNQAGGAPSVVLIQPAGQSVAVVIGGIDYDAPFSIDVTAIDFHGNASATASFPCDSLAAGGSC